LIDPLMAIQVTLNIPTHNVADFSAIYVQIPSAEGSMGILKNHAPLRCELIPGTVICRLPDQSLKVFFVSSGLAMVQSNTVTILADTAELADEIDLTRAEAARNRALGRLCEGTMHIDRARAEAALHRSLARLEAVRYLKTH